MQLYIFLESGGNVRKTRLYVFSNWPVFFPLLVPEVQPRPQGFSLKKWVGKGKSPGDEVARSPVEESEVAGVRKGRERGFWARAGSARGSPAISRPNILSFPFRGGLGPFRTYIRPESTLYCRAG